MSYDYSGLQATATRLIARFGRDMTLRTIVQTGTAYDPTNTNSDVTVKGVFTNYKASQIDGTIIQANDKMVIVDSSVQPVPENRIVDGTDEYTVIDVDEIKPGDTSMIYKIQVRRG